MYHISLHHDAFGIEGAEYFSGTLSQAKRKAASPQHRAGHGWRAVINAQTGEMLTWSVSKVAASKGQRMLGTPWILAKLEPAR